MFSFLGFFLSKEGIAQLELTRLFGGGDRAVFIHSSKHLESAPNHTGLMLLKSFFLKVTCPLLGVEVPLTDLKIKGILFYQTPYGSRLACKATTTRCTRLRNPYPPPFSLCFEVYFPTFSLEFFPSSPAMAREQQGGGHFKGSSSPLILPCPSPL